MKIMDGWEAMDAGPKSEKKFHDLIMSCKTILWNGQWEFLNFQILQKEQFLLENQ